MLKDKLSANVLFLLLRIFCLLNNAVIINCTEQRFAIEPQDQVSVHIINYLCAKNPVNRSYV